MSVAKRDRVLPRLIEEEMRESFLDYSMSVIVQRALPDVRDGLKPVHRRILYAMHEAGLGPGRPYKKSATVVGDVLGKYHPHGDSAVYDSMVRMVQDFSLRYPLVDGQGNFGSIDGDNAAAYRYTEARLSRIATEMLADIDRDTVDFAPNFDDRLQEPRVLPARVPNLLVNGSSGIAVGMSTNVPPHNLGEVVGAAIHLLDHPECSVADLMKHLPGPDFPTGGLIVGTEGIRQAYRTGRGRVVMRARAIRETRRGGREQLVVTEIPYGTNKSRIIEQIADLAKRGKITDIADLRDESDREGIRIVVELKRDGDAAKTLDALHRWTHLQSTFGVIMLALEGGVPREFGLKELLERFRDHRLEVTVRRSRWELARARDEAHVLQGLLIALKHIDAVVRLIRGSKTRDTAARKLQKEYTLSERQAEAILNMRLVKLTALETRELRGRLAELEARMAELEAILANPERRIAILRGELRALVEAYGDPRRTRIVEDGAEMVLERATADEEVVVTVSREGYAKQIPMELYRRRLSSGKRLAGMERYESDYLERAFSVSTFATLLLFTEDGRAYGLPVEEIPEGGRASRGRSLHPLLGIPRRTRIVGVFPLVGEVGDRVVVFATAEGTVKRTSLDQFTQLRAGGVAAILLRPRDRVIAVEVSDGEGELVLVGSGGRAIRFREEDAALMGRTAQGVRGIRLGAGERAVGMTVARREGEMCTVSAGGWAKRTSIDELAVQGRGGLGAPFALLDAETGSLVAALEMGQGEDLMAVSVAGRLLRILGEEVPREERGGRGVRVVELTESERLAEVTRVGSPRPSPDAEGEDEEIEAAEIEATEIEAAEEAAQLELAPVAEETTEE